MSKDYGDYFNIAHIEPECHIYGPGKRLVVWLQGCSLACEGCWNQDMWSFRERNLLHRQALLEMILASPVIEGITLLGGEPLQQAANTLWLLRQLRESSTLTVILYSGFTLAEVHAMGMLNSIDQMVDLFISGRYQKAQRTTFHQWIGSTNQEFYYPESSRITARSARVNEVEIIISEHGDVRMLGYPKDL